MSFGPTVEPDISLSSVSQEEEEDMADLGKTIALDLDDESDDGMDLMNMDITPKKDNKLERAKEGNRVQKENISDNSQEPISVTPEPSIREGDKRKQNMREPKKWGNYNPFKMDLKAQQKNQKESSKETSQMNSNEHVAQRKERNPPKKFQPKQLNKFRRPHPGMVRRRNQSELTAIQEQPGEEEDRSLKKANINQKITDEKSVKMSNNSQDKDQQNYEQTQQEYELKVPKREKSFSDLIKIANKEVELEQRKQNEISNSERKPANKRFQRLKQPPKEYEEEDDLELYKQDFVEVLSQSQTSDSPSFKDTKDDYLCTEEFQDNGTLDKERTSCTERSQPKIQRYEYLVGLVNQIKRLKNLELKMVEKKYDDLQDAVTNNFLYLESQNDKATREVKEHNSIIDTASMALDSLLKSCKTLNQIRRED
ncbi:unnamed protein product [Moneuplotes crassus]|uniref:Uncharacterized protein n=1 Tax=Euplotes crassus TaxID=5936 RepID=A0AAD1UBF2_EUPCR|nr:unnamed protein product [Moneuplotes crassus]